MFIVVDYCEQWEQPLALRKGPALPPDGVLDWGDPIALFSSKASARAAITRTTHYGLAFGKDMPGRNACRIRPVQEVTP